jgi:ATP-binding cassette, subfamily C (CFTR/MRP), member 1
MFEWMTPMMSLGYSRFITHSDMYTLPAKDTTENLGNKLQHYWDLELKKKKCDIHDRLPLIDCSPSSLNSPSLWRALAKAYGGPFAVAVRIFRSSSWSP